MSSPSKQNPFVFCQVLERNVLLLSSYVGVRECGIEMRLSECRSRDPRALRRCPHQCQIQVACRQVSPRHCIARIDKDLFKVTVGGGGGTGVENRACTPPP